MTKILIIGANGQLGQHLIKFFQQNYPEFKIIGTVRHKSYDKQPKIYDESKLTTELLELTDSVSVEECIKKHKPDYLINTSANAFVGESWLLPESQLDTTGVGVLRILEAIRKHSPETRFLNLGSSEEMGCTLDDVSRGSQDETTKLNPRSPYACAKVLARNIIDTYRQSYKLYAVQPWNFNFESELRGEKYFTRKITKGVARIYHAIKNQQPFAPIEVGNLNSYRSWQHAEDVAEGLWLILNQEQHRDDLKSLMVTREIKNSAYWSDKIKPYVLSENQTHPLKEFVEKAFAVAGIYGYWEENGLQEKFLVENSLIEEHQLKSWTLISVNPEFFRPNEVSFLFGNSNKARQELNWVPKVSFEQLVKRMVLNDLKSS